MKLKGFTPEEQERRKEQAAKTISGTTDNPRYTIVKFNEKDTSEIRSLIEDLETNVGLRDVSPADLLIMLVNRYRLQRRDYKDKSKL